MATANSKQGKKGRSMHPSTQVSSYGLDSTMNLDAVRVQRYKEVRGRKKEKYGSKVNGYCSKPNQAGEDRNKQNCSNPRLAKNAGPKMPEN